MKPITAFWTVPATITPNNFVNKSLSSWSLNIAVGCAHACRFCYVPEVSTRKLGAKLAGLGVDDPDAQWGEYVFLRPWDEKAFLASLAKAERTPAAELNADGNRAVMLSTTTDPYMVIRNTDAKEQRKLNEARSTMVRRALELIRDRSTLNVRILTRSPMARLDFDLMQSFGNRLLFGVSLPTMREDLARIYEPKAPGPTKRFELLQEAKQMGIPLFVAMAPTFPECDRDDLARTMSHAAALDPVTVFHEPINIRAENVARIAAHAITLGVTPKTDVFETPKKWAAYSFAQLDAVEQDAGNLGISDRLHLWPDSGLKKFANADRQAWLSTWWGKVSGWPGTGN